ncbi:MAG: phage major capsid protein [Acidimicrobiia bacterium]
MGASETVRDLRAQRQRAWSEGKALLDETRGQFSAEQQAKWQRINAHLNELDIAIDNTIDAVNRENEAAVIRSIHPELDDRFHRPAFGASESDRLRAFAQRGGPSEYEVNLAPAFAERQMIRSGADARELRALYSDTGSVGSAVPTSMSRTLVEYLEASSALMKMPTTKLNTASGEPIRIPKITAHTIGTQVSGMGTTIGGTDPAFIFVELSAFKYGALVQVANEVITDAGVDMAEFLGRDIGRAVGRVLSTDLVLGTGSGEPLGVVAALTGSGTIATGGSLINPTVEKLLDLVYSVNAEYRSDPSCSWLMNDSTAGTIRKLRDGAGGSTGALLWTPSQVTGLLERTPDTLFSYPVYTDFNVAALGSASKSIVFGAFNSYFIRTVGNFVVERDDSLGFASDTAYYRGKWRVDADLVDTTGALNLLTQRVA